MTMESDMEVICRTCLNETDSFKSIFKVGMLCGEITTLSAMLADCTSIEFNEDEDLPRFICMKCVHQVSKSWLFRQSVAKANETLREQHTNIKTEEDIIDTLFYYEQSVQSEIIEEGGEEEDEVDEEEEEEEEDEVRSEEITIDDHNIKIELSSTDTDEVCRYELAVLKDDEQIMIERNEEVVDECSQTSSGREHDIVQQLSHEMKQENLLNTQKRRQRKKNVPGPPFRCEICGKILSNHSSYKYHMQLHSDATPFLCSHCGEKFKTRNAYDGHMTTHDLLNPNSCNICGKTYRQPSSLRIHILTHTGEKPYLCGICGKGLTQKSGFKKHMLTHTGEKPFRCDICNKEFRYSSNLITHKRGHTGEKPFECKECDKKFTSGEQLKRHHLIHSGERPFSCDTCGKSFNRRSTLMVHKQIHNGKATSTKITALMPPIKEKE